jgi:hypothetical protein
MELHVEVEGDDYDTFIILYQHHHSILREINFLSTNDSLYFININT